MNRVQRDIEELQPRIDLASPRPLKVVLPILLSGDLVQSPEHLGPAYIGAVLRNAGATVTIIEAVIGNDDAALDAIVASRPDIVGLSITTVAVDQARQFGVRLRDALGDSVFVVAGGPVATHLGIGLLTTPGWEFLDGLIRGEGEIPMLRLAEALHGSRNLSAVPNLSYRYGDRVQQNLMQPGVSDLNSLPFPVRDQLRMHKGRLPYVRVSTSRGCTAFCTFCNAPHVRNRVGPPVKAWRGVSPQRVVDEVEMLVRTYGCNTFDFVDSTFEDPGGGAIGKGRIEAIANEILARGLKIYFNVCMQAYNWTEADRPLLKLLWRAGLEKVCVGIESGNEADLLRWQKRSTVEDNRRVVRLLQEVGVHVAFGFIAFHPWSTFEEIRENQAFLRANVGHNLRRYTVRLELYPGAEVIEQLRAERMLAEDFFETLNPYGYIYRDPRVYTLATCVNAMFGAEYAETCKIRDEPAVFKFETYSVVVHDFITRIARACPEDQASLEILHEFKAIVATAKKDMAEHNFALMSELTDLAERDLLQVKHVVRWAEPTEEFFNERMQFIETEKIRCGLRLRRHGFDVGLIGGDAVARSRISA
ncbi:radical SAM protein [Bradyrhizobium diazoefficiens]|uniref:B12-binding domain-containing radical SAM protein n=1 Tax=Bradyrhizobium diazoefficiens TaxID=1355477 RepID=UPI001B8C95EA|nr:radical SAM protein [Bradyrhizobium diazoefficiens]MBR0865898.1 radical SAM protein [Bradyrhizobium diazoefficiens]MBR0890428.1 radical SAM protein [Bradyrhizobium diazoefficiens]MBR0922198.1 radical SAM protein [Bradyrhizobium diazoefficiens]